jgi:hypothetical protein
VAPLQERRGRAAGAHGAPCNITRSPIFCNLRDNVAQIYGFSHEYIRILAPKLPKLAFSHRKMYILRDKASRSPYDNDKKH